MISSVLPPTLSHINWSESLHQLAQKFGSRPFASNGAEDSLSYAELNAYAHAVAKALIQKGVQSAEPVASLLDNQLASIWVTYGIKLNGAAEVPLNFNSTKDEVLWCADVAKFKWIITYEKKAAELSALGFHVLSIESLVALIQQSNPLEDFGQEILPSVSSSDWEEYCSPLGQPENPRALSTPTKGDGLLNKCSKLPCHSSLKRDPSSC